MKKAPDPLVKAAEAMPAKERHRKCSPARKSGGNLEKWRRRNPVCWKSDRSREDPRQKGW